MERLVLITPWNVMSKETQKYANACRNGVLSYLCALTRLQIGGSFAIRSLIGFDGPILISPLLQKMLMSRT